MVRAVKLGATLGWHDIKLAYRRTSLGQFWITVSMALQVGAIGLVFGGLLGLDYPEFFPHVASGLVLWSFFFSVITEAPSVFLLNDVIIRSLKIPLMTFIVRLLWRGLINMAHHLPVIVIAFLGFSINSSMNTLWSLLGFVLGVLTVAAIATTLAVAGAFFRDLQQVTTSVMGITFFVTPVIWRAGDFASINPISNVLALNPFFHLIEIVRAPLMGYEPGLYNWVVSAALLIVSGICSLVVLRSFKAKIPLVL